MDEDVMKDVFCRSTCYRLQGRCAFGNIVFERR